MKTNRHKKLGVGGNRAYTGRDVRLINHHYLVVELNDFHLSLSKWPKAPAGVL